MQRILHNRLLHQHRHLRDANRPSLRSSGQRVRGVRRRAEMRRLRQMRLRPGEMQYGLLRRERCVRSLSQSEQGHLRHRRRGVRWM